MYFQAGAATFLRTMESYRSDDEITGECIQSKSSLLSGNADIEMQQDHTIAETITFEVV
jgi:hypothetical protein